MKKIITVTISAFLGMLLLAGCGKDANETEPLAGASDTEEQTKQETPSPEEAALSAYSAFLSGDKALMDEEQQKIWWIPNFQDDGLDYEYTYLDLDGDSISELIVQMEDAPISYNAVFHFEDDKIFCWNSDAVEMTCYDYPLSDGTIVRQYNYNGSHSYTIYRYQKNGELVKISSLYVRDEYEPVDSSWPFPYYEVDEKEVDKTEFDKQVIASVLNKRLDRAVWTKIISSNS